MKIYGLLTATFLSTALIAGCGKKSSTPDAGAEVANSGKEASTS